MNLNDDEIKCYILYFDSSYNKQRKNRICNHLRNYLESEYKHKNIDLPEIDASTVKAITVAVQQQNDDTSCGLYMILILERFLIDPIYYVGEPVSTIGWFDEFDVIKKREIFANAVKNLIVSYNPTALENIPDIQLPTLDGEIIPVDSPKIHKKFRMKENRDANENEKSSKQYKY